MKGIMSMERLAAEVRERRKELGLTQAHVAARGGVSEKFVRRIENSEVGSLRAANTLALEKALQWGPGSVQAILAGEAPTIVAPEAAAISTAPLQPAEPTSDKFALARRVLALRDTFADHQDTISPESREALAAEMARSAREAEETIIRMMGWLDDTERGQAIDLLVELRNALQATSR